MASCNQLHVLSDMMSKIPLDAVHKAEMLRTEVMANISKIIHGTLRVPDSTLVNKLDDIEARKRLATAELSSDKTPKKSKSEKSAEKEDRSGIIICNKKGIMPPPPGEGTTDRICMGFVRVGAFCRQGANCPNIHNLSPESWPATALKLWYPHVEGHENLRWAKEVKIDAVKAAYDKLTAPADGK